MIDLLYVSYNRLLYTRATFAALLRYTNWNLVRKLYVHDDGSTDGTWEYLLRAINDVPEPAISVLHGTRLGGPVDAMNWYLDQHEDDGAPLEIFGKVDNDMIVCPYWLEEMLRVLEAQPELDILGMEPFIGDPTMPPLAARTITLARHIGGKGLIRHRSFAGGQRMNADGYQGFTQWQHAHEGVRKAWVTPDLPVFGLDQLPFEPWLTISDEFVARGWHRHWPPYHVAGGDYWDWWMNTPAGQPA